MRISIKDITEKSKSFLRSLGNKEIFTVLIIILVASASFGLGRLSKLEGTAFPIRVENTAAVIAGEGTGLVQTGTIPEVPIKIGTYVASKTGEKYHLPWCSGAQRIKEENKVWFDSKEAAEQAGYTPAANCKGL